MTGHEAMAAFAQAQRALVHARRTQTATFGSLFLLAVAGSLWVSEVSVSKVVTGFPGLVAYVAGTLPMIRLESVSADVGVGLGLGRWLTLLLDTLVIAFMGTLLGATGAFVLGFPRRAIWHPIAAAVSGIRLHGPGAGLCAHVCVCLRSPGRSLACSPLPSTRWAVWASSFPRWLKILTQGLGGVARPVRTGGTVR